MFYVWFSAERTFPLKKYSGLSQKWKAMCENVIL